VAQENGFWPKQYFQTTYPFWPDDYWQDASTITPPPAWCGWWPQQYWPTPNAYFPKYYWPGCAPSVIVIEPISIESGAVFGNPLVYNTGDEPTGRQERVKGFEHISWVQY
jgi:hypothetical protein